MATRYKRGTDLYFTEDGDFYLDAETGDFEDTSLHQYRNFIQNVNTRVASSKRDWNLQRDVGLNLADFLGKPNTRENGARIRNRVYSELIRDNFIAPADLEVVVFPTGKTTVGIVLRITPPDEAAKITLTYSYNMQDNKVTPRNI